MRPSNIDLHIGELILRGLPFAQRQHIAAALEQELTRLITERGLPPSLARGGYIPDISIDSLQIAVDAKPEAIGGQIAQSVYSGLSRGGSSAPPWLDKHDLANVGYQGGAEPPLL